MTPHTRGERPDEARPAATVEETDVAGALELELRQLSGVRFVSLHTSGTTTVVELGTDEGTNLDRLRSEARRVVLGHIDGPVVIDVVSDDPTGAAGSRLDRRVRLLLTGSRAGGDGVVAHLAYQERQVTIEAEAEDRETVATGVLDGLRRLGFGVRFEVVAARGLADDAGSGTLVILGDPVTGARRRGLAGGPGDRGGPESTARAVLNALNRFLQPSPAERQAS